ncbi:MAG: YbaK/EbsC family protein [Pseudomonadota bacterium]
MPLETGFYLTKTQTLAGIPLSDLPKSALKVHRALGDAGLKATIIRMPTATRTAEEAATACRCDVSQIVKSLVFQGKTSGSPILLLVSGSNRVDTKKVAETIGEALDRPDGRAVRTMTGFAIGGIPPLGHAVSMKTYIDEDLLEFETVWAAAGTPDCIFDAPPRTLAEAAGAITIRVC